MLIRQYGQLNQWGKICCKRRYVLAGARAGDSVERRVVAEERYVLIVDVHELTLKLHVLTSRMSELTSAKPVLPIKARTV